MPGSPNAVSEIGTLDAASQSGSMGPLIGHYAHPLDPSQRTALCGTEILGISAFGEFEACETCQTFWQARRYARLPHEEGLSDRLSDERIGDLLRAFFETP